MRLGNSACKVLLGPGHQSGFTFETADAVTLPVRGQDACGGRLHAKAQMLAPAWASESSDSTLVSTESPEPAARSCTSCRCR